MEENLLTVHIGKDDIMQKNVYDISDCQANEPEIVSRLKNEENADGIILKIGETLKGVPTIDDMFVKFVNDAVANELPYGIYYVSHARDMDMFLTEANWINDKVFELLDGKEPPMGTYWDMEVDSVCRDDVWPQLRDTIGTMQSWWNNSNKIGIYAGYSYYKQYIDLDELANYPIPVWVAQYGYHENSLKEEYPNLYHIGWQFTTNDETLDQNKWYGKI